MNRKYAEFASDLEIYIDSKQISTDLILNQALGTDASFYSLTPKVIVKTFNESDVINVIKLASKHNLGITFRAAGTSLSGQTVTDSILVIVNYKWEKFELIDNGKQIKLQPGIIGDRANAILAPMGYKIGPDPASSSSCMIGGIVMNNASGMCCGVEQNSYQTIKSIRIILANGTVLDTGSDVSKNDFIKSNPNFIDKLNSIAIKAKSDPALSLRIKQKYKIKNTTGYSLNALIDFSDPFDIIRNLMVGSEGTLAFLSDVVLKTVPNNPYKATALIFFSGLFDTCKAVESFRQAPNLVAAAELMDRVALRSIESLNGVPDFIKSLPEQTVCLLVEAQSQTEDELIAKVTSIQAILNNFSLVIDYEFSQDPSKYNLYWKMRKGILPCIGATRALGTTVLTEDIAFPLDKLADGTLALRKLLDSYGYNAAGIVGHALACNLHFIFTPDITIASHIDKYDLFMQEFTSLIVDKFDGSLKGEHGTGRNIAPFVEKEWGAKAYQLMKEIKELFDPTNILNPDVIFCKNNKDYIKNLKPIPTVSPIVDQCIECGSCENICPSKNLTLTPRQRIAMWRHISTLKGTQKAHGLKLFEYYGIKTCASDSLCKSKCPIGIDTGEFIKSIKFANKESSYKLTLIADNFSYTINTARLGLTSYSIFKNIFNENITKTLVNKLADKIPLIPRYNSNLPKAGSLLKKTTKMSNPNKVVFFSSCANRMLGDKGSLSIEEAFKKVCHRANYDIINATDNDLCCGMLFSSKGADDIAMQKSCELEITLQRLTNNGDYPIVIDASSCMYHSIAKFSNNFKIFDFVGFLHNKIADKLLIKKQPGKYAFHITCASIKNGDTDIFKELAASLVETPIFPNSVNCCGFAGDKGLYTPELNASALENLQSEISGCIKGYSNNKSCEIGLSQHSQIDYSSIIFLYEKATR